jgi:hypothetical protein
MFYFITIRYTRRYCPSCRFNWATLRSGNQLRLDRSVVACASCGYAIPTGWREWPELSEKEKKDYLFDGLTSWYWLLIWGVFIIVTSVSPDRMVAVRIDLIIAGFLGICWLLVLGWRGVGVVRSIARHKRPQH